mmetsp:Transcript_71979/g.153958  ORF Transcript_71979/g.153958 Transcript_71979/m.153958 type:complete len:240 (+) Transcript_71979:548-1267(+)
MGAITPSTDASVRLDLHRHIRLCALLRGFYRALQLLARLEGDHNNRDFEGLKHGVLQGHQLHVGFPGLLTNDDAFWLQVQDGFEPLEEAILPDDEHRPLRGGRDLRRRPPLRACRNVLEVLLSGELLPALAPILHLIRHPVGRLCNDLVDEARYVLLQTHAVLVSHDAKGQGLQDPGHFRSSLHLEDLHLLREDAEATEALGLHASLGQFQDWQHQLGSREALAAVRQLLEDADLARAV